MPKSTDLLISPVKWGQYWNYHHNFLHFFRWKIGGNWPITWLWLKNVNASCWRCVIQRHDSIQIWNQPRKCGRQVSRSKVWQLVAAQHHGQVESCQFPKFVILTNGMSTLIFLERSHDKCAIWLWMYIINVGPDHHPCFMMMVYVIPISFGAITPPARSEWAPMRLVSIPTLSNLDTRAMTWTCWTILEDWTKSHLLLFFLNSHKSVSLSPPLESIWCKTGKIIMYTMATDANTGLRTQDMSTHWTVNNDVKLNTFFYQQTNCGTVLTPLWNSRNHPKKSSKWATTWSSSHHCIV